MTTCHDIQLYWELPSTAHFCSLFRAAFNLLDFDIEELEEAILTDGLDGSASPLVVELLVRLLQGCMPGRSVTPSNIDSCLRKLFRQKCQDFPWQENLFPEGDFRHLSLRKKVVILHTLCEFRLDVDDVHDLLKNLETESLRVEPLGFDEKGSTYWYFYGTRLYREDHSVYHPLRRKSKEEKRKHKRKRKNAIVDIEQDENSIWQVECFTQEDWTNLAERFEGCESRLERQLLSTLKEDFLPEIPRLFQEKERRRLQEFAPRRTSGRVQKLKEKKEEEEKRLASQDLKVPPNPELQPKEHQEDSLLLEQMQPTSPCEPAATPERSLEDELLADLQENSYTPHKKRRSKKRTEPCYKEQADWHCSDGGDDVVQERELVGSPEAEQSPPKRKHKDKKSHHKKHNHRKKSHKGPPAEPFLEESLAVSDTSNKENTCLNHAVSDAEETHITTEVAKPKVFGRKTNNSLASVAFSLTPSTVVPDSSPQIANSQPTKKKVKSAQMLLQTEEELRTGMYKVLEQLSAHEEAWVFKDRVDESFAPNYYIVIRRPMYICKMEEKLDSGAYTSLSAFEADFKLMMDNCKLYNGPDSEYTHIAFKLEKFFAKLKSKYLVTEFSSDEEICIDMGFQQLPHRKKKYSKDVPQIPKEPEKKKRGRKKKKVGRKPKNSEEKIRHGKHKSKAKSPFPSDLDDEDSEQGQMQPEEEEPEHEDDEICEEQDLFQDDDYNMDPVLMVREDPFSKPTRTLSPIKVYSEDSFAESGAEAAGWDDDPSPLPGDISEHDEHPQEDSPDVSQVEGQSEDRREGEYLATPDPKLSDSEYDTDHDVALLYYHNPEEDRLDVTSPPGDGGLFGDTADMDEELRKSTKHKSDSPKKKHKHHHRRHHKRKPKHSPSKSLKKVLSVDDVFDLSEEEGIAVPLEAASLKIEPAKECSPHKKRTKHKSKHERHHKHQKHKVDRKSRKHNRKKSKSLKPLNTEALDVLAEATEISLKAMDGSVVELPRKFASNSPTDLPSTTVGGQEREDVPTEVEMQTKSSSADKKSRKRKKKHDVTCSEILKKKTKKIKKAEPDAEKEKKSESSTSKALFRDLKEGKIKPGAIIKSKDLAKKEGQVKKETKASTDPKTKGKPNPFGKINKEENSKLGSLIAKAKESRIGLVPNSEVGDSPKLSLGSIILSGDIGSTKHSAHEPEDLEDEKPPEKYDSPWDQQWDKQDSKDESSQFAVQSVEDEEEYKEEIEETCEESPETVIEEVIQPPPTPKGPELKQEKATPNLSAWFRAFGGPKLSSPRKRLNGSIDDEDEYEVDLRNDEMGEDLEEPVDVDDLPDNKSVQVDVKALHSPNSLPEELAMASPIPTRNSTPEPPVSPVKPPETPWYDKINEKPEDEPIWKKNKSDEDEDPYKFEEEELDRAREEAKKLEVERQRKASVSSSGLSDPSPLNIDSDRSPAFSSEGERSPMTRSSPAMRSPVTPGFGSTKQYSPATEKSGAFSPRFESGKGYTSYESDKRKYPANGNVKVGHFYQDIGDKSGQDKVESVKSLELKHKESPIYSPTVPYVSPFYNKESSLGKQKSPGRFSSYYSSIDASLDKPKTPGYYPASAPSTPSDRPSPASAADEKQKSQYNYCSFDTNKPLTDQYKSTGPSSSKPYYEPNGERSPVSQTPCGPVGMGSPAQRPSVHKLPPDKMDLQPPKKRPLAHRAAVADMSSMGKSWDDKNSSHRNVGHDPFMPLTANLANLSQIVSRIPEPCGDITDKSIGPTDAHSAKTVHPQNPFNHPPEGHPSLNSRPSSIRPSLSDSAVDMQPLSHVPLQSGDHTSHLQPPPAAHQKTAGLDRSTSRNDPPQAHAGDKALSYLHPKTMWTSSLPSSIASSSLPSSLSSFTNAASMASFALAGQKGLAPLSSEHLAHFDRAALANLTGRQSQNSSNLFPHELLQRSATATQSAPTSTNNTSSSMSHQSATHSRSSGSQSASANNANSSSTNNFDLGMARSYASLMTAVSQSSTLFGRNENSLGRSLSGSSSPFLSQSPGLGTSLGMSGSSRTPTPAHQPSLNQANFPAPIGRDPRDPISHTHPSLQIPSLNSISNGQSIGHLNTSNLGYPSRDSLALMNQGGRNSLVPSGTLDPQQFYTTYLHRQQLAQEELLLRSAGMATPQLAAHQSMMLQHGLMPAGYPSGYPHSLGLRSGTYQGMTRPWI